MKVNKTQVYSPVLRRYRGFSLLEMVIVLGIMAMIMGGAIFTMRKIKNSANIQRVRGDIESYMTALSMYKTNGGMYPSEEQGLQALVERPRTAPRPRDWEASADEIVLDPWGNDYVYEYNGKGEPVVLSKGPDGAIGTDDDISSAKKK